jgi:hypothetical protein
VIERGQDLPFVAEAAEDEVGVHSALDQLDRCALAELIVRSNCQVYRAHSAPPDFADEFVSADAPPDHRVELQRDGVILRQGVVERRGRFDEVAGLFVAIDEVFDPMTQRWGAAAGFGQEAFAFIDGPV